VKKHTDTFSIHNYQQFKTQMLSWASRFNICVLLDNNEYTSSYHSVECILAVDAVNTFTNTQNTIADLSAFLQSTNSWIFGHVNYDFKNELYPLSSNHKSEISFPDIFFFQPKIIVELKKQEVIISCTHHSSKEIFRDILAEKIMQQPVMALHIQPSFTKEEYVNAIEQLQKHIMRGDCYEINFCQEFFAENADVHPHSLYHQLCNVSPVPFAAYYKLNDQYLMCASPERYIKKSGNTIISQPIKGTYKRNLSDASADSILKEKLSADPKEKSENVMVVDLVRNDLSKICAEGSVMVEELFGIYTFPQVHQMISTIRGELKKDTDFADVLKATFPMGSMTGAPKSKVMQLIEQYEKTKRGIFSGCIGYISPNKDFDFNVVIRSIMYNETKKYLSYQVGSGITFNSNAEKEYEECLLKAEAMRKVLMNE
jgi:para-aminobenzoate synthetase component 1